MKMLLLSCVCLVTLAACKSSAPAPLPTVDQVNVSRYMGKWHEIFRLPNSFQRDDSKATAEYTLQPDGKVKVVNTELRPDGSTKTATGEAEAVQDGKNSRFKVKFSGLAAIVPVPDEGNYWIIGLTPDYSRALVGTPDRQFLWLLSRSPTLTQREKAEYLSKAKTLGFPVEKVIQHP